MLPAGEKKKKKGGREEERLIKRGRTHAHDYICSVEMQRNLHGGPSDD